MPSFIPGQGLQFDYKYLLIRENQKKTTVSSGRIKTDLVAVLFLWDGGNLAQFNFESQVEPLCLHVKYSDQCINSSSSFELFCCTLN